MSPESAVARGPGGPVVEGETSLHVLVREASRQLTICNACRYCEGLCAVFPALERRSLLDIGQVSQLANLCHDCRACYDACMYAPPHEFAVDLPRALSAVRLEDYSRHVWPWRVPRALSGWSGVFIGSVISVAVVLGVAVTHAGWRGLFIRQESAASPYQVVPYGALLVLLLATSLYAVVIFALAAWSYWRETRGGASGVSVRAVATATWHAATLRYLRGGGAECYYPDDDTPSRSRRLLHAAVAYGFGLCVVSTVAANVEQDMVGIDPPYPWLSVPVISGTVGGVMLAWGCVGLLVLKARSSPATSVRAMNVKDYGLLVALAFLALSGIAVLLTRDTAAFGLVFLAHLAAVIQAFAMAPYSKFIHLVFRFAALVRDSVERREHEETADPVAHRRQE